MTGPATKHWTKGKLQDLVFFQRGFDITQVQQAEGPVPVISSSGVTSHHNEARAMGPGVVIGRKGTLGSVHLTSSQFGSILLDMIPGTRCPMNAGRRQEDLA